jgi:hypothetical protein
MVRLLRALLSLLLCLPVQAQIAETIRQTGPVARRVNLVVVGDGYTSDQFPKFRSDATNAFTALLGAFSSGDEPLVNGFWVFRESKESGCDDPSLGIVRDTAYNSSHSPSTHRLLGPDYYGTLLALSDGAVIAPTNCIVAVLVNTTAYGGAGGLVMSGSVHASSAEIIRHEFGHTFARLSDEYCTSYPGWRQFETANSSSNRLNPVWSYITTNWIAGSQYNCTVWGRAFANCKMKDLGRPFCPVCVDAIHRMVLKWTGGAEDAKPAPREFRVRVVQ